MSLLQFAGSKKKARIAERDARRVRAVKKRLERIYELARLIKSEQELDTYLTAIPDDAVRAETRKLIEPFLLFKVRRVQLVTSEPIDLAAAPEKATTEVVLT